MTCNPLTALSPLDGRYAGKVDALREHFSEFGLIKARLKVEIEWLKALAAEGRDWVHGRCHLELGKLADVSGERTAAVAEYRRAAALCGKDRDPVGREEAERLLKTSYTGTNATPGRQ